MKALRGDNRGEYMSNEFKKLCAKEGIRRELRTTHNPQKNGVVERNNCRIVGLEWVILHDQGLPLHLWAKACNTTFYLQKKSLSRILGMIIVEEDLSGGNSNVSHFRTFKFLEPLFTSMSPKNQGWS